MQLTATNWALQCKVRFNLKTPLLLRSGQEGEFSDSSIERDFEGKVHINGYVWNSLLIRAISRIGEAKDLNRKISEDDKGVSPLWAESSSVEIPIFDIRPGISISRECGASIEGALYNEELVPPGAVIESQFNYFAVNEEDAEAMRRAIENALYIIDEGVETIGGGWTYGFGKLGFKSACYNILDLRKDADRKALWAFDMTAPCKMKAKAPKNLVKPWKRYDITFSISDGQILAVHANHMAVDTFDDYKNIEKLPDKYVFRSYRIDQSDKKGFKSEFVVPGKAVRQALLSVPYERMLRSQGSNVCHQTNVKRTPDKECGCSRCRWFGSVNRRGLISVEDAVVDDAETAVPTRVQLCEHSMQNVELFSGEYLSKGSFSAEIIVDCEDGRDPVSKMIAEIQSAPPGWYRLGATSTCTGQIELTKCKLKKGTGEWQILYPARSTS